MYDKRDFYRRREDEERTMAMKARDPSVRWAHLALAQHYAVLLGRLEGDTVVEARTTVAVAQPNRAADDAAPATGRGRQRLRALFAAHVESGSDHE